MGMLRQAMMTLVAAGLLAGPAAAQGDPAGPRSETRPGWGGAMVERSPVSLLLARREALGLTADQVRQLEAIQARVARENAPRLEQLRETNRAAFEEAREVLTPEQQERLREVMREGRPGADRRPGLRGDRPARPGGPGGPGRSARRAPELRGRGAPVPGGMAARVLEQREALGLTSDQVVRLEALRDRLEQESAGRLEQLRSAGEERAELVRAIRASQRASMDAVREILTDEQEATLRELRRDRRVRR